MLQGTTPQVERPLWHGKIVPYSGRSTENSLFPVSWNACLVPFDSIIKDLSSLIVADLKGRRKIRQDHIPDLLQQSWLQLWRELHTNPRLLAKMPKQVAAGYVANRSGATTYMNYYKRYGSYHDLPERNSEPFEDSITEIVIGSGLKSSGKPGHALFTRHVDIFIDIEKVMREMAAWCGNDIRKLVALYYVTTSVRGTDLSLLMGGSVSKAPGRSPRSSNLTYWSRVVKRRLQEVLADYKPIEPNTHFWRKCLEQGHTQPVVELAIKYANNRMRLLALYTLTTSVSVETLVTELGVNREALRYAVKRIRRELRWMYATHMSNCG